MITEILVEDSRGVFRGQVGQDDIYEGAEFTDLGLYLVGSMIIWVRLRASILDCRTAEVLSMSQFRLRSPNIKTLKINGGQLIHIWCPGGSWGLIFQL